MEQMQAEALDRSVMVSDLLRKAKVVASKLDLLEFLTWTDAELNGYKPGQDVPDYRILRGEVCAFNPARGWVSVVWKDPEQREAVSVHRVRESIGELADLVQRTDGELCISLGSMLISYGGLMEEETNVRVDIDRARFAGILESARNIILEWSLKLEKAGITGKGLSFSEKEKAAAHSPSVVYNINRIENAGVVGEVSDHASVKARQTRTVASIDKSEIRKIINHIKTNLDEVEFSHEQRAVAQAQMELLDSELIHREPDRKRVRSSLETLKTLFESTVSGAAGNLVAQGILFGIMRLLS
ncbi:MAG: hypothetical protein WCD12_12365 [Candidatus Binatus sp.]|uniref:AbiTii domain-containing protein n=1 Tax=Candidatus Binatus sp. TaxID=2811406 RepID=UPI003C753272